MKRVLAVLSLVLLVIAAGCVGAATPTSTAADSDPDAGGSADQTVSVSATGSVSVEPDLAVVSLAVEARADEADAARAQVATDVAAVREALADLGLADDAVTTAYFHLQPEYDYSNGGEGRELLGYRAVHALVVEADLDRAGAVVDAAVGAGAVRVDGVQFTLSDDSRQTAREGAIQAAMANAEADATAIADAADVRLDGVRSASTAGPVVVPYAARLDAAEAGGETRFEPGPVSVTASVQVVYAIA